MSNASRIPSQGLVPTVYGTGYPVMNYPTYAGPPSSQSSYTGQLQAPSAHCEAFSFLLQNLLKDQQLIVEVAAIWILCYPKFTINQGAITERPMQTQAGTPKNAIDSN
jgi:hypothetical protein